MADRDAGCLFFFRPARVMFRIHGIPLVVMDANEDNDRARPPLGLTSFNVRRAKEGEAKAVEWLVRRFSPFLLAQARYRLSTCDPRPAVDAEDIVNEVLFSALKKLPQLATHGGRHTPTLMRYLSTALVRRFNAILRDEIRGRGAREPATPSRIEGAPAGDVLSAVIESIVRVETCGEVLRAVEALEPTDRKIVVLRWIEGHRSRDIAQWLGMEANTVVQRCRRALDKLRASLPDDIVDELGP